MTCTACATNTVPDQSGFGCRCADGFSNTDATNATNACQACNVGGGEATSEDVSSCVTCQGGGTVTNGVCVCPNAGQEAVIQFANTGDALTTATCTTCPTGFYADPNNRYRCVECPYPGMTYDATLVCKCPTGLANTGGTCIPSGNVGNPDTYGVISQAGISTSSHLFTEMYPAALYFCETYQNDTACEVLSNICVLNLYDGSSTACTDYNRLLGSTSVSNNGIASWPSTLPWLYYSSTGSETLLEDTQITKVARFAKNDPVAAKLTFLLAAYALNGTFLGFEDMSAQVQLCMNETAPDFRDNFKFFADPYDLECDLTPNNLLYMPETIFYDPYFVDDNNVLVPVPVIVTNLRTSSGSEPNTDPDDYKGLQLTRRFFMYDTVSARTAASVDSLKTMRIASSFRLRVTLKKGSDSSFDGEFELPAMIISYTDVASSAFLTATSVDFKADYTMSMSDYNTNRMIAYLVVSVFAFFVFLLMLSAWRRRTQEPSMNGSALIHTLVLLFSAYAGVLFLTLFGIGLYWLIFYKGQSTVSVLLPSSSDEGVFLMVLIMVFAMKTLEVLELIRTQSNIDIFFIDWERKKNQRKEVHDHESGRTSGVSVWRSYFVANEWNEIQTVRKVNIKLQLLGLLVILVGFDVQYLATRNPSDSLTPGPWSSILRFAVASSIWAGLALLQVIWKDIFQKRFVSDQLQDFVDLCSICNVSVFIMTEPHYGFYLHGSSPFGYADTDMWEMNELLKKEELDLIQRRGLIPDTDNQQFEMYLPVKLRNQYDSVFLNLLSQDDSSKRLQEKGPKVSGSVTYLSEKSIEAHQRVNKLLSRFIDHMLPDVDYVIRDKTYIEDFLGLAADVGEKGLFYIDEGHAFDACLFWGNEWCLTVFEISLFCIIDYGIVDYTISAFLTYLINRLIVNIRQSSGKRNIVNKTLIDSRFLI
eukprot:Nk52_evm23s242 gene=Nk52_evmTU23s242